MQKRLLILILFSVNYFTPQKSEAQLYKHWGHWITDTTLDAPNEYTRVYGMVCDTADNLYVQYHDPETGFDTISIKCIGRNGNIKWNRQYYHNKGNKQNFREYSKLVRWGNRVISCQPYYVENVSFNYLFYELNPEDGSVIESWDIPSPRTVNMHGYPEPIVNDDGNFYFSGDFGKSAFNTTEYNIVKFNLPSRSVSYVPHACFDESFAYNYPHLMDINDSLMSFSSATYYDDHDKIGTQISVIKKADLSFHSVKVLRSNTGVAKAHSIGNIVSFIGGTYYELNLANNEYTNIGTVNSRSSAIDNYNNLYLSQFGKNYFRKVKPTTLDTSWLYTFQHPDSNIKFGEADFFANENIIANSNLLRYLRTEHFGDLFAGFGNKTVLLNQQGETLDEHIELFDTARGSQMDGDILKVLDSKGNPIYLLSYVNRNDYDSVPQTRLYNRSFYVYKLCVDCDTTSPPPIAPASFENYLQIIENPTKNKLHYKFGIVTNNRLSFYISDLSGKIVYKKYFDGLDKGQYQNEYDMKQLGIQPGLYILTMQTSYAKYAKKFIYSP